MCQLHQLGVCTSIVNRGCVLCVHVYPSGGCVYYNYSERQLNQLRLVLCVLYVIIVSVSLWLVNVVLWALNYSECQCIRQWCTIIVCVPVSVKAVPVCTIMYSEPLCQVNFGSGCVYYNVSLSLWLVNLYYNYSEHCVSPCVPVSALAGQLRQWWYYNNTCQCTIIIVRCVPVSALVVWHCLLWLSVTVSVKADYSEFLAVRYVDWLAHCIIEQCKTTVYWIVGTSQVCMPGIRGHFTVL